MSGALPGDPPGNPNERDALAGEYVLGTLDARDAARVTAALANDTALRQAVAAWERRLAPLSALAVPQAPPEGLWQRIEAALAPVAARPAPRRLGIWQFWAIGATLAAAAFAGVAYVPRAPAPRMMAVLVTGQSQPAFAAEVMPSGGLHLAAMTSMAGTRPQAPAGRQWELWGQAPGATAPTSLGMIPMHGSTVNIATPAVQPQKNMLIMISVEPPGGSPTGQPSGPVVFFGRLMPAGNT